MRAIEIVETVAIFLAIFSLWPVILGWQHGAWKIFMYVMLAAMAAVFVRRWLAYRKLLNAHSSDRQKRGSP